MSDTPTSDVTPKPDGREPGASPNLPPMGWYQDPERPPLEEIERFWDGAAWTEQRRDAEGKELDPPGWYPDPPRALSRRIWQ